MGETAAHLLDGAFVLCATVAGFGALLAFAVALDTAAHAWRARHRRR